MPDTGPFRGTILVIGGDSLIGKGLAARWTEAGADVIATSRRENPGAALYLDLMRQEDFAIPPGVNAAVIAAGATGFRTCEHSPAAAEINMVKVPALAERLIAAGAFVVLLSSSAVFAQDAKRPGEDSPHCPDTEYGRQKSLGEKKAVERAAALNADDRLCVVRLTKAVDIAAGPVSDWLNAWREGKPARAFSDVRASPVTLEYLAKGVMAVIIRSVSGNAHFSGEAGMSYVELCQSLAARLGTSGGPVAVATSREAGVFAPFRPIDGAIGMRRTGEATGMSPQPAEDVLRALSRDAFQKLRQG